MNEWHFQFIYWHSEYEFPNEMSKVSGKVGEMKISHHSGRFPRRKWKTLPQSLQLPGDYITEIRKKNGKTDIP